MQAPDEAIPELVQAVLIPDDISSTLSRGWSTSIRTSEEDTQNILQNNKNQKKPSFEKL